ncbi:flagellar biosynthesis protein FlgE [Methylobacterium sp. Leaf87]|uniref:flagellar hook protein FlgE n=1 Tax=Methylobacterium sp. Leaf87 TaxID=1736243 RepID=UPI0006FF3AED|nr:flagellar hook-basal body complex protein [Methylobacterium sp. Leaf87]KQO66679.1 flagellar biosynthesis protein FlgE [Methylobacterium sp. Leaf87]
MDIFSALQTAVSGLQAQSYSLNNISGNIANSQTTGFKRVDTNFVDMIAEQPLNKQVSGSVGAFSRLTNTIQGGLVSTGIDTNMALSGKGFFTVQTKTGDAAGQAGFSTTQYYTRRGDFKSDNQGYLVNGAGGYVTGQNFDPRTGATTGTGPIQISTASLAAKATKSIAYAANLPMTPSTKNASAATAGSELLTKLSSGTAYGAVTADPTPAKLGNPIKGSDANKFMDDTLSGGSLTAYTETGAPMTVQLRWAKVQNATTATAAAGTGTTGAAAGGTTTAATGGKDVWNLFYLGNSKATDTQDAWQNVGQAFTFEGGQLKSPASPAITDLTVDGVKLTDVKLNIAAGGLTQYAASEGTVRTDTLQQDGYASGTLTSLSVTSDGKITGTYSNGNSAALAQVGIVQFKDPDSLKGDTNGNYTQTLGSGAPITGLNGSSVVGGEIEQSNTDIAAEFSKMIVTQQAYSANTRVMSTAQTMMSDLINIIR